MTFLLPAELRRKWERMTHCPAVFRMMGTDLLCQMKWHPEGTPHQHDEVTWDWGEPPFDEPPRP